MKKNRKSYGYHIVIALVVFVLFGLQGMDVYAAQGQVTFGSQGYIWYTEEVCPIGVYINSDAPIESYEICVQFDETKLQYLDGATEKVGSQLYIRGTGTATGYKTMLHFRPLQPGDTAVQVISASAMTVPNVSVNQLQEAIEIVQLSGVPVHIAQSIGNELTELKVNGIDIEGFSPEIKEYSLTVEAETEAADISYVAEDEAATVTISDTSLQIGENIITVSVRGTANEDNVYTLLITRKEPVVETSEEEEVPTTEVEEVVEEPPVIEEILSEEAQIESEVIEALSESTLVESFFQKPLLWVAVVIVSILAVIYFIFYLVNKKKKTNAVEEEKDKALQVIDLEQTVINVQNVSMRFKLAQDEASSLKEYLIRAIKGQNHYNYLMALNDVSFEVSQGDVLGIIGTNGSGKSTLLKIISGALKPTSGHVDVDRSKVQMLTLGTGFDMELTAKENVYLNGAIIGYTREYINEKYDDIVKFAELEGFMDERMKNFSSGMVSRLGFAIATMRDTPEILILDEVLSVGDRLFQQKSMKRIKEMIHSGATVIMVSHSIDTIKNNCNKAVWIEKGILKMVGEPNEVCEAYRKFEG